jgi:hypothetical protein
MQSPVENRMTPGIIRSWFPLAETTYIRRCPETIVPKSGNHFSACLNILIILNMIYYYLSSFIRMRGDDNSVFINL